MNVSKNDYTRDLQRQYADLRLKTPIGATFPWGEAHRQVLVTDCGRRYTVEVAHPVTLLAAA